MWSFQNKKMTNSPHLISYSNKVSQCYCDSQRSTCCKGWWEPGSRTEIRVRSCVSPLYWEKEILTLALTKSISFEVSVQQADSDEYTEPLLVLLTSHPHIYRIGYFFNNDHHGEDCKTRKSQSNRTSSTSYQFILPEASIKTADPQCGNLE